MGEAQTTLRQALEASMTEIDTPVVAHTQEPAVIEQAVNTAAEDKITAERLRDEAGRFAKAQAEADAAKVAEVKADAPAVTDPQAQAAPIPDAITQERPTTWKKEYLPLYDKLATGTLTAEEGKRLAAYNVQREREYATGVSNYKAEAQKSKDLQDAMQEFMPALQQYNTPPATWIKNLGSAHHVMVFGTPEQKLQLFSNMAQQYGVPLAAVQGMQTGQGIDPVNLQLMQHIQDLSSKVNQTIGWREQQEQQQLMTEISKFSDATKYPHFEQVRGDMAQLLESGIAPNLDAAYAKAVRMNDEVWTAEQERQANAQTAKQAADKAAAIARAKANSVSPKSVAPSGNPANNVAKDRRAALMDQFDSMGGGRV